MNYINITLAMSLTTYKFSKNMMKIDKWETACVMTHTVERTETSVIKVCEKFTLHNSSNDDQ